MVLKFVLNVESDTVALAVLAPLTAGNMAAAMLPTRAAV